MQPLAGGREEGDECFVRRRFFDEPERVDAVALHGEIRIGSDEDNDRAFVAGVQLSCHVDAVFPRQLDVEKDDVRTQGIILPPERLGVEAFGKGVFSP